MAQHAHESQVVLVEHKKNKKKKKGKKPGLLGRVVGKVVLGAATAAERVGEALHDAGDKYRRKHHKSRERRRDGVTRHLGRNIASAVTELMDGSAKAPVKFFKTLWKKDKKKRKKKRDDHRLREPAATNVSAQPTA